jgi:hypothetical protein
MRSFKIPVQLATYTVRFAKRKDRYFDPAKNDGLCEPNVKRIYIASRLSDDCKFTTFVHELLHAVYIELDRGDIAYNEVLTETTSQIIARAVRSLPEGFK